ncbi:hypothetical protein QJS10_CPB04g00288 [Acorus calamus]|uniref:uridine/cytidine kinase n=1 Tax=Acorus calamus TaxID=4465 RepID=A0AAV9F272_ACOCL|nr:hypothetical protein QJS10_CPB04g00288 [Acorus calamus]
MGYVMEAASAAHFTGLRVDGLLSDPSTPTSDIPAPPKQPFVIGVSGGTASGKTTVCDMIIQQLHDHRVVLINQDSFYHGLTAEESEHVSEYNFDHPDAFDNEQLLECIEQLKCGKSVNVPIYDFKNHRRCSERFRKVNASDVIILEGILVFHKQRVRNLMNMKITQYAKFVKPAFDDFVLPSKKYADVILPRGEVLVNRYEECTLIRDREISKHDFIFYSDRLIRLVVEHGLGHLPFTEKQVITPTGYLLTFGLIPKHDNRGESMENALRACCKGIKIGKILIHRDGDNGKQAPEGIHCVCQRFPSLKIVTSEIDVALNEEYRVIPGLGEYGDRYFGTDD